MSSHILCKFWGFSKRISTKLLGILGSTFQRSLKLLCSFNTQNFFLLALSDNDKPMLMRKKCIQGFAYTGKLLRYWLSFRRHENQYQIRLLFTHEIGASLVLCHTIV